MEPLASVGLSTLYVDDVVDFLNAYDGRAFDLTVTSPPYNLGKDYGEGEDADDMDLADYFDWVELWGNLLYEQTTEHGRLCINVPLDVNLHGKRLFAADINLAMLAAGWEFQTAIVWNKGIINNKTAYGSWLSASAPNLMMPVELVLVFNREGWIRGTKGRTSQITREQFMEWRTSVWSFPGAQASKVGQPAPFPLELPKRCLKLFAFDEDLICDPFVGSGTTCEAAELLGRASVGVDQSAEYLTTLAVPRIAAARDIREGAMTDGHDQRWVNLPMVGAAS